MEKLVLIDGHSIINRAFYGVPDLSNAQGLHTNGIYGFLNIMFKILEEEKPDYLVVAFDVSAPTFRHEIYQAYKGTRKPTPEELREQVPVLKEVLAAMDIAIIEKAGLEADDILGTLAKQAESQGMAVSLVSGDRDLLQIATDRIKIRIPKTKGGRTEVEDYYAADVEARYQVTPTQFIDVKALMGDASDNIPGVPKIGEKTATELVVQFGSLEGVYSRIEEITKKAVKDSLLNHRELADLSKVLATININGSFEFSLEDARIRNFYTEAAYRFFQQLEFKNMLGRFEKGLSDNAQVHSFKEITDLAEAEAIFEKIVNQQFSREDFIGFAILEDSGRLEDFVGLSIAVSGEEVYFFRTQGFLTKEYLLDRLSGLPEQVRLASFDIKAKYDYLIRAEQIRQSGLKAVDIFFDILIAAYLLNPLKNHFEIEDIANEFLGLQVEGRTQLFAKSTLKEAAVKWESEMCIYACYYAYICREAAPVLLQRLNETGMAGLMKDLEMPLSYVLHDMEKLGILVRPAELQSYGEALTGRINELEKAIYSQVGCEFNINSPKQLGEILFERLKLPGGKKTKSGFSTAADVLEKLEKEYPIVTDILEYRGLAKLKSTYAEGLAVYIEEDNRIHTNFQQTVTATGRLSSTEPNLQNIPMRMELGRLIRKVFIPAEGYVFMDADYSQIELRILAHMSADEQLIEAYRMEEDIHRITAAKVFHTPFAEVTELQRRNAKAVNFGIVYGISSFGLSQDLSISKKEAETYINQYFATYPKVKQFLDEAVAGARKNGYVTTLFGRRRPIPELASSNFMQRSFGERVAMNSPIQGTAADIIKVAMVRVWERLKKEGLQTRLILQIHDELLLETVKEEVEQVRLILTEEMRAAAKLAVVLEIDLHLGESWYEAK